MKTNSIIICLTIIFIIFIVVSNASEIQSSSSYVFVKQWGSIGEGDGQFEGIYVALESTFMITDEVIKNLKGQISDEKLKILESMKNIEFSDEFSYDLRDLKFNNQERRIVLIATALKKVSDKIANGPLDIAVDKSDNVYVSDLYNARVQKFDSEGNFILKWGNGGEGDGQFNSLIGITVDCEGYIYVVECSNHRVQKFDSRGNFILKWGSEGHGDGQFDMASNIAADHKGYIYVADDKHAPKSYNGLEGRLQKFDSNGNFLGKRSASSVITAITVDPMGYIFLASDNTWVYRTITKYKSDPIYPGKLTNVLSKEIWFTCVGLATDKKGNLFALDRNGSCVYKFNPNGEILTKWGSFGSGNGEFNRPEAVAVDSKENVYVMDTGNYRIQKFAPVSNTNN